VHHRDARIHPDGHQALHRVGAVHHGHRPWVVHRDHPHHRDGPRGAAAGACQVGAEWACPTPKSVPAVAEWACPMPMSAAGVGRPQVPQWAHPQQAHLELAHLEQAQLPRAGLPRAGLPGRPGPRGLRGLPLQARRVQARRVQARRVQAVRVRPEPRPLAGPGPQRPPRRGLPPGQPGGTGGHHHWR